MLIDDNFNSNVVPFVDNGYFECLDGVITDESAYLQAAIESCKINGKLYGIPYDCQFEFASYKAVPAITL